MTAITQSSHFILGVFDTCRDREGTFTEQTFPRRRRDLSRTIFSHGKVPLRPPIRRTFVCLQYTTKCVRRVALVGNVCGVAVVV